MKNYAFLHGYLDKQALNETEILTGIGALGGGATGLLANYIENKVNEEEGGYLIPALLGAGVGAGGGFGLGMYRAKKALKKADKNKGKKESALKNLAVKNLSDSKYLKPMSKAEYEARMAEDVELIGDPDDVHEEKPVDYSKGGTISDYIKTPEGAAKLQEYQSKIDSQDSAIRDLGSQLGISHTNTSLLDHIATNPSEDSETRVLSDEQKEHAAEELKKIFERHETANSVDKGRMEIDRDNNKIYEKDSELNAVFDIEKFKNIAELNSVPRDFIDTLAEHVDHDPVKLKEIYDKAQSSGDFFGEIYNLVQQIDAGLDKESMDKSAYKKIQDASIGAVAGIPVGLIVNHLINKATGGQGGHFGAGALGALGGGTIGFGYGIDRQKKLKKYFKDEVKALDTGLDKTHKDTAGTQAVVDRLNALADLNKGKYKDKAEELGKYLGTVDEAEKYVEKLVKPLTEGGNMADRYLDFSNRNYDHLDQTGGFSWKGEAPQHYRHEDGNITVFSDGFKGGVGESGGFKALAERLKDYYRNKRK